VINDIFPEEKLVWKNPGHGGNIRKPVTKVILKFRSFCKKYFNFD